MRIVMSWPWVNFWVSLVGSHAELFLIASCHLCLGRPVFLFLFLEGDRRRAMENDGMGRFFDVGCCALVVFPLLLLFRFFVFFSNILERAVKSYLSECAGL